MTALHDASLALLREWVAPDDVQEGLRGGFIDYLEQHPDGVRRACRPDHVTSSAIIVGPDGSRACLVLHRKARLWLQTGGHVEDSDVDLPSAALREAREESGIADLTVDPVPLRLSRHAVPFCGGAGNAEQRTDRTPDVTHHLDVQFLVTSRADAATTVSEESDDVRWFDADHPPEPTDDEVRALLTAARQRLRGTPRP